MLRRLGTPLGLFILCRILHPGEALFRIRATPENFSLESRVDLFSLFSSVEQYPHVSALVKSNSSQIRVLWMEQQLAYCFSLPVSIIDCLFVFGCEKHV